MRIVFIGLATLIAASAAGQQPASAAPRPWCIQPSIFSGGDPICNFHTYEQCRATGGPGGWCIENPKIEWARRAQQNQRRPDRGRERRY